MWWAYTRGGAYIQGGLIVGGLRYVKEKLNQIK